MREGDHEVRTPRGVLAVRLTTWVSSSTTTTSFENLPFTNYVTSG
jgi:hypothetical protein